MKRPALSTIHPATAGFVLLVSSFPVFAHYPTLDCELRNSSVHCKAGYSDGSAAQGAVVRLYSYDEEMLQSASADDRSEVKFDVPDAEYFISFNPGHDRPAEVDYIELK